MTQYTEQDIDDLRDLVQHPGWKLFQERLSLVDEQTTETLRTNKDWAEVCRAQGASRILETVSIIPQIIEREYESIPKKERP